MKSLLTILAVGIFVAARMSSVAGTVYLDRSSFNAASGASVVETFENSPLSGNADSGAVAARTFQYFSLSSTPAAIKIVDTPYFGAHNITAGGSRYLFLDTDIGFTGSSTTFMSFFTPVTAFGFSMTDLDSSSLTITIPGEQPFVVPGGPDGNEKFWGFVSTTPFSSVNINSGNDSSLGVDDVVLTPEPSALSFLVLSLALLVRRHRS